MDTAATRPSVQFQRASTLTKSRASARAIWSLQHGRFLTISELLRIQGFKPERVRTKVLSPRQMGARIGNAFTLPVYKKVLRRAINAAERD